MIQLAVHFEHGTESSETISASVVSILGAHNTLAMATVSQSGESYINTAHYGFDSSLNIYIVTQAFTEHSKNGYENPSVAAAVWDEPEEFGTNLRGLQMFGTYKRVESAGLQHAIDSFTSNIPAYGQFVKTPEDADAGESKLHVLQIDRVKLLDEPTFGRRNYLSLALTR